MNARQLREELAATIKSLKSGELETKTAQEITNAAGKMINSAKAECDYLQYHKSARKIGFFEDEDSSE